jgi:serine/threonine protein phosphatase PrpC
MSTFTFDCAGASHVGLARKINEDAWLARPDLGLWVVADGMGGHERGDLASRMVVEALAQLPLPADARTLREDVETALVAVNGRLQAMAGPNGVIGTTIVLLLIHGRHFAVLWAGDSRAYRRRDGLEQLTRDHSLVQDLIDRGELAPELAERHPLRNVVGRAIGADAELALEAVQGELQAGDLFLLCSDGLTKHLDGPALAGLLDGDPTATSARRLIEATLAAGASDNVTVLLVHVTGEPALDDEKTHPPQPEAAP